MAGDPLKGNLRDSHKKSDLSLLRDREIENNNSQQFNEVMNAAERHINLRESQYNKQRTTLLKAI